MGDSELIEIKRANIELQASLNSALDEIKRQGEKIAKLERRIKGVQGNMISFGLY